ncbi:hypothetical protein ACLMJK_000945 [Lecanora helva]
MSLATAAAVAASATAGAAYLDAKLHLRKDLSALWLLKSVEWEFKRHEKADRLSCLYIFEEAVSKYPDVEAIWSREGNYTFKEVHDRACQYAAYFLGGGVRPGHTVALCLQNSPEFIFAWLGLWVIGCAPAMINFNLSGEALIHCLKVSGANLLLVDPEPKIRDRVEAEKRRIEKDLGLTIVELNADLKSSIAAKPAQRPDDSYRSGLAGSFPAAIFYTSGTTGLPKGATFSTSRMHMAGCSRATVAAQKKGPGGDRWYICMPMYHGTGGIHTMTSLMAGVSVAIGKGFSVRNFWRDVHDSQATFFIYVGETARYLLAAPPSPFERDHKIRCMWGNGLRPDVWNRFRERFNVPEVAEFFNSSEGMLSLFIWNRGEYTAACVGHHGAIMRYALKDYFVPVEIDHDTNDIVRDPKTGFAKRNPYTKGGEIIVRLTSTEDFPGYWNNPEATKKKFVRDVFEKGDLFYRSGDALRRSDDGRWFFLDRLGDTYRWKSENVSTAEVSEILGRYPGILEANVYGVQVPGHEGRAGCVALTMSPELRGKFDWNAFTKAAREQMPPYAVPVFVRILEGETGSGASHTNKQDKVKLRTEGVDPGLRGSKVPGGKKDEFYWLAPKGNQYLPFTAQNWQSLGNGTARL